MEINQIIESDYIEAYKRKDALKLSVLRLLKSAIKNRLVEKKQPRGKLADEEILDIIIKQAKQRKDSIIMFKNGNREDLAAKEESELAILQNYLPQQLSEEEIDILIDTVIKTFGINDKKGKGQIMAEIMKNHKGKIDGKMLAQKVGNKLG